MIFDSFKIKKVIIMIALAFIAMPAFAENIISSVVISKSKDGLNTYELNIDSTQQVQYKSHIDSDGNVYFDLKNSSLAPNMGTIYDDVSEIDNVVVKQLPKNKVRIYVNGKNARDTELVFINSLFETSKETKNIVINKPINEYKSTSYYNDDLEYADVTKEWDDNSFDLEHLSSVILSEMKEGPTGKILIILSLFTILSILAKSLVNKVAQEKEPLIKNKVQIGSIGASVDLSKQKIINSKRDEALRQAQNELTKAHEKYQQYIQNKYQGLQKPKPIDVDLVKKSFALNQYQKSTQNPYKDQEVIRINKGYSTDTQLKGNFQIPPRPKMPQEFTSPYIKRTNNFVNTNSIKEQPKQNMKFLESVTQIYERSGRGDLASELKNSITKAKQKV